MVVFGHFIENFQDIWNSGYTRVAWQFIYLFHMPGFAFISGYFSKKKDTRIFEKVLEKQIIPLVLFQFLFEILNIIYAHEFTGATFALTPYWTLWYLLSLAFWKIFFQILYKVKFILAISIVLAPRNSVFAKISIIVEWAVAFLERKFSFLSILGMFLTFKSLIMAET